MTVELREASFWVLTALARGRSHGYALMRGAQDLSGGTVALKPASLYAALDRLERHGLIAQDGDEAVDGRQRRYFRLTADGFALLSSEADRMRDMVDVADRVLREA